MIIRENIKFDFNADHYYNILLMVISFECYRKKIGGISDSKLKSIFTFLLVESLRIDGFNGSIASIERVRM